GRAAAATSCGAGGAVGAASTARVVQPARRARAQLAAASAAAIKLASWSGSLSCGATDQNYNGSASVAMSKPRIVPPADPSAETVRTYLAANAQRELDALRTELDARLSALEAALASPDSHASLEKLVLDLARVAT